MPKISNVYLDKKSNRWYFVANLGYDENGNRVRYWGRGFSSQKEAKKAYDEYMNDYSKTSVKINSTMSYQEFYNTYYLPHYKQTVRISTYENRVVSMNKHFKFFFKRKLKDINAPIIKKWQNTLVNKYSRGYTRSIYGSFQKTLDLAVTLGLLQKNIAQQVGNVKKIKTKVDFWTVDEFKRFITQFDKNIYYEHYSFIVIWFLFMTGLRFGEAQALKWEDIDFKKKLVTINKSMYYKNAQVYYITETKTISSNRMITLDNKTLDNLKQWKLVQSENCPSNYVLSYNGIPINKHAPKHIIDNNYKSVGVHRIKVHALRHSHASMLISMQESALVIKERLGHEDIETTLGTYGHLYPNYNKEVASKIDKLFEKN